MRLYTALFTLVQGLLLPLLATAGGTSKSMEQAFDDGFALNTTVLDVDTTNCTIAHIKHTETMTCIFSKPKAHMVNCARTQGRDNDSPPLRIRISGVDNVTYVPESPESMLNIFVARDLYRDHKVKSKRTVNATGIINVRDSSYEFRKWKEGPLRRAYMQVKASFVIMMTLIGFIVFLVAMFNAQHMFKMGASNQKEILDLALQRNELIDKIQECVLQKKWLQAELAKVKAEEDKDDCETLSMATIVS